MKRYRTGGGGHWKVRSREVRMLKVESLVLNKKIECEREKGEGDTHEGL
jgi:hypothetical protein